jgi:hypothetical protein
MTLSRMTTIDEVQARLNATLTYTGFLAFVQSRPKRGKFRYTDNCECAVAQFVKREGFEGVSVSPTFVTVRVQTGEYSLVATRIPQRVIDGMDIVIKTANEWYTWGDLAKALASV